MGCFIIAEAGVNHNGSLDLALKLVEEAANAGADAVKFQTFKAEALVTPQAQKAQYQQDTTGLGTQFNMLKALELSAAMHHEIYNHCKKFNIEFMSTGFDIQSIQFLLELGIKRIKIPSGEITNFPMLEFVAKTNLPLIISTGMASLQEVQEAIQIVKITREHLQLAESLASKITILHCTSNYPTQLNNVNLRAMQTMADEFRLPVGYSDHTQGILVSPIAVALGARVIEKHFTMDRNLPGPDHSCSLEPAELTQMIKNIRSAEYCFGDGKKEPRVSELPIRDLVRKSLSLKNAKKLGSQISIDDLILLRPGNGIAPKELKNVVGKKLAKDLPSFATLQWDDLVT